MNAVMTNDVITNDVMTRESYEQVYQSSETLFPAAPFPKKYVHSVFNDPQDAVEAVFTLLAAGYDANTIHILSSQQYMEAVERGQTRFASLTSMDLDDYLEEASRGHAMLVMRPASYGQLMQIRNLLAPHHAHLMKYIDTWTTSDLIP
jgi:hypothetical protein